MCGICGLVTPHEKTVDVSVRAMMRAMIHRGPDDEGLERILLGQGSEQKVGGLGFRRLSVMDLSFAGHQPMVDPRTGDCIVFNGEIYNFKELRLELEQLGEPFRGGSDTEVLLKSLVHWGEDILDRLDGMFAFAWYQSSRRRLLMARDPSGIKPLYWTITGQNFAFASEIKALHVLPWLDRRVDYRSIAGHLGTLFAPHDATMFASVKKLQPGCVMVLDDTNAPRIRRFAPTLYAEEPDIDDRRQAATECLTVLSHSVGRQLVADVPVGGFLSGGLDSSAIACLAARAGVNGSDYPVFTMRLGNLSHSNEGFVEDLPHASRVAKSFGLKLHVVTASPNLHAQTDQMVWQLDEPIADPAALNVWYLCEAARATGVTVLLSGAGADDIFTGYRRHTAIKFASLWERAPFRLRKAFQAMSERGARGTALGRRLARLWRDMDKSPEERMIGFFLWLDSQMIRGVMSPDAYSQIGDWTPEAALAQSLSDVPASTSPLNKMLAIEQQHFLADHNLIYTDKMSMAHGIEVRVPFLSPDVIRFAERLQPRIKHRGMAGKSVLRDAMRGLLPPAILSRSKTGFGTNLRNVVPGLVRERLLGGNTGGIMQFMQRDAVSRLLSMHESNQRDAAYPLYSLVCLDSWIRQFGAIP